MIVFKRFPSPASCAECGLAFETNFFETSEISVHAFFALASGLRSCGRGFDYLPAPGLHCRIRAGEVLAKVLSGFFPRIGEDLAFGLEVAQLKYQVNCDRHRAYCRHSCPLRSAQLEEEIPIRAGETRKSIQIIDFIG